MNGMQRPLIIGTRGSPLAMYQAQLVQRLLGMQSRLHEGQYGERFPIKIFKTTGDKIKGELSEFGGKGLFTKELEEALLSGQVDMAVHSMKDVPTLSQPGLSIGAILPREDPRDAFISRDGIFFEDLPQGAVIGTASIRRRAQVAAKRPDIKFVLLRGNVGTRLGKLTDGVCDATFLAVAGLNRLNEAQLITHPMPLETMLPAPAQGAIGIETRTDDAATKAAITPLSDYNSHMAITAERAFLKALDGSCKTPIAALAQIDGTTLHFRGEAVSKDGQMIFTREKTITAESFEDAYALGIALGHSIKEEAGERIIWDD